MKKGYGLTFELLWVKLLPGISLETKKIAVSLFSHISIMINSAFTSEFLLSEWSSCSCFLHRSLLGGFSLLNKQKIDGSVLIVLYYFVSATISRHKIKSSSWSSHLIREVLSQNTDVLIQLKSKTTKVFTYTVLVP